jgi:hypothetical protein
MEFEIPEYIPSDCVHIYLEKVDWLINRFNNLCFNWFVRTGHNGGFTLHLNLKNPMEDKKYKDKLKKPNLNHDNKNWEAKADLSSNFVDKGVQTQEPAEKVLQDRLQMLHESNLFMQNNNCKVRDDLDDLGKKKIEMEKIIEDLRESKIKLYNEVEDLKTDKNLLHNEKLIEKIIFKEEQKIKRPETIESKKIKKTLKEKIGEGFDSKIDEIATSLKNKMDSKLVQDNKSLLMEVEHYKQVVEDYQKRIVENKPTKVIENKDAAKFINIVKNIQDNLLSINGINCNEKYKNIKIKIFEMKGLIKSSSAMKIAEVLYDCCENLYRLMNLFQLKSLEIAKLVNGLS